MTEKPKNVKKVKYEGREYYMTLPPEIVPIKGGFKKVFTLRLAK